MGMLLSLPMIVAGVVLMKLPGSTTDGKDARG
jgi:hypothetical protein